MLELHQNNEGTNLAEMYFFALKSTVTRDKYKRRLENFFNFCKLGGGEPVEGIIGSGNNVNIQVQENTGNNAVGQSSSDGSSGSSYSDESLFQGQSTDQSSRVVS